MSDDDVFSGEWVLELGSTAEPTPSPTPLPTPLPTSLPTSSATGLTVALWLLLVAVAGVTLYKAWQAYAEMVEVRRITLLDDNDFNDDDEDEDILGPRLPSAIDNTYIS